MTSSPPLPRPSWKQSIAALANPRVGTMLFLGFSAGIPILLIFSSLSLWLGEAGLIVGTLLGAVSGFFGGKLGEVVTTANGVSIVGLALVLLASRFV